MISDKEFMLQFLLILLLSCFTNIFGLSGKARQAVSHCLSQNSCIIRMTASSNFESTGKQQKKEHQYAPSRYVTDGDTGEKWRLCAGAAVLNSKNELLIGERTTVQNAWQAPQGGVDDAWQPEGETKLRPAETVLEASNRELYEEMGLVVGRHVMLDTAFASEERRPAVRYRTSGTSSWLTKSGFAGQELHWTIYRLIDAHADRDPEKICDLSGKNGERAEFSGVKWQHIEDVVGNIWEKKREPYEALQKVIHDVDKKWKDDVSSLDLAGTWSRDSSRCSGLLDGLLVRGLTEEAAKKEVKKPYIQHWTRVNSTGSWKVTTFDVDGKTPRRELVYTPGEWDEFYKGDAVLFGSKNEGYTLRRWTSYLAEPEAHPCPIAHVTLTDGPKGTEESRRYLKDNCLILRRTLWPKSTPDSQVVSTEVFVRTEL